MMHNRSGLSSTLVASMVVVMLSGCVTRPQPLYYWGDFTTQQYSYFKGDKGPEEVIQSLERVREEAKAAGKPVPPGLLAHLGLMYGQTGRTDMFEQNLQAERHQFPESSVYVDFLLKKKQNDKAPK